MLCKRGHEAYPERPAVRFAGRRIFGAPVRDVTGHQINQRLAMILERRECCTGPEGVPRHVLPSGVWELPCTHGRTDRRLKARRRESRYTRCRDRVRKGANRRRCRKGHSSPTFRAQKRLGLHCNCCTAQCQRAADPQERQCDNSHPRDYADNWPSEATNPFQNRKNWKQTATHPIDRRALRDNQQKWAFPCRSQIPAKMELSPRYLRTAATLWPQCPRIKAEKRLVTGPD